MSDVPEVKGSTIFGSIPETSPTFAHIASEKLGEWTFRLYPQLWTNDQLQTFEGSTWESIRFETSGDAQNINTIPNLPGVYMFVVKGRIDCFPDHSYIFYVGKAERALRARYREYIEEARGANPQDDRYEIVRMLNSFLGCIYFCYLTTDRDRCADLESAIKDNLTPPANKIIKIKARLFSDESH